MIFRRQPAVLVGDGWGSWKYRLSREWLSGRTVLRLVGTIAALHATVLLVSPGRAADLLAADTSRAADFWLRQAGVAFFGVAVMCFAAARAPSSMMQRPALWAAGVSTIALGFLGLPVLMDGTVTGWYGLACAVELVVGARAIGLLVTDGV